MIHNYHLFERTLTPICNLLISFKFKTEGSPVNGHAKGTPVVPE